MFKWLNYFIDDSLERLVESHIQERDKLYETSLKELSDAVKNLIREHAEEQHQLCVHVISENNEAVQKIVAEYTEKMMVTVSSITAVYEKANHELKDIITQQSEVIEQLSNNNTTS